MAEGLGRVKALWEGQERRFALWSPVLIGVGVWCRLESGWDVGLPVVAVVALLSGVGILVSRRGGRALGYFISAASVLLVLGYGAASFRVAQVAAPVLEAGFQGMVTGRVVAIDRSRSRAPRVVLDRLALAGVHPGAVPAKARITLVDLEEAPAIGTVISLRSVLGAPSGPAAPGAFDFSRQAFFRQIGAVGYARGSVETQEAVPDEGLLLRFARLRAEVSRTLREQVGGEEGAVAAALIVGDRSEISAETTQALRDSGLAHLLAISGLHIGLMSALSYGLVRFGLALMPVFASRVAIRKIAAIAGLAAALLYLALAGFGVATQRAFIMAAVAFTAILLDRPAVTVRGLAVAACLVLLLRPESLFEAGFQMSFAAVAALVAGYEVTRTFWRSRAKQATFGQRLSTGLAATVTTSVIAGLATTPFAAYHFNRLVAYGLPANVLATPMMGLWIMPAIILTAVLAPFGLAGVGLAILGWGVGYILWVADSVASLDGAALSVSAGSPAALALIVLGGLWLVIWQSGWRVVGVLPIVLGVLAWRETEPPDLLIAAKARLVAGQTETGKLWVSRERASGYFAETWLRRSGAGDDTQEDAFARRQWSCTRALCRGITGKDVPVILVRNRSMILLRRHCRLDAIVIAPKLFAPAGPSMPCTLIDRGILDQASSISVTLRAGSPALVEQAEPTRLVRRQ